MRKHPVDYGAELKKDTEGNLLLEVHTPTGGGFRVSASQDADTLIQVVGEGFGSLAKGERAMMRGMIRKEFQRFIRCRPIESEAVRAFYHNLQHAQIEYLEQELEVLKAKK